jgi:hypothetical protein
MRDLRFAPRGPVADRTFSTTAIVILDLAISLNTTVFAVMNAALFRGFPVVKRNDRVVYMQDRNALHTLPLVPGLRGLDRTRSLLWVWRLWRAGRSLSAMEGDGPWILSLPR